VPGRRPPPSSSSRVSIPIRCRAFAIPSLFERPDPRSCQRTVRHSVRSRRAVTAQLVERVKSRSSFAELSQHNPHNPRFRQKGRKRTSWTRRVRFETCNPSARPDLGERLVADEEVPSVRRTPNPPPRCWPATPALVGPSGTRPGAGGRRACLHRPARRFRHPGRPRTGRSCGTSPRTDPGSAGSHGWNDRAGRCGARSRQFSRLAERHSSCRVPRG